MPSAHNGVRTAVLFGALATGLILMGHLLGGTPGMGVGLLTASAINAFGYFRSDAIALRSMGAQPASEARYPQLYDTVRELSTAARQPMPSLYVSPATHANAFATGRSSRHAAVCCTDGILRLLDERELRAVLGHELSHVYNRDILTSSVAGGFAAAITFVAQKTVSLGGSSHRSMNPLVAALMLVLGPMAASVIQLAISRSREYQADASAAQLTGDPLALARALDKIDAAVRAHPLASGPRFQASSHLLIADPFNGPILFSTHPPMHERIARLEQLATQDPRFWR